MKKYINIILLATFILSVEKINVLGDTTASSEITFLSEEKFPYFKYIQSEYTYISSLMKKGNSSPGTIVLPIMFHSISDSCIRDSWEDTCITDIEFYELMDKLIENDFEAISSEEFIDFTYNNSLIPERSALLIVDDRRNGIYFDKFFRPFYEQYGWTVINAYIASTNLRTSVIEENVLLEKEGWVDHQAHGSFHNIFFADWRSDVIVNNMSALKYIDNEISYPIKFFDEYFNKKPVLFMYPGGSYTKYSAKLIGDYGYKAAFTTSARGVIMFNAIPLSDEHTLNMPLFVLPRYWAHNVSNKIEGIIETQNEAKKFFNENTIKYKFYKEQND